MGIIAIGRIDFRQFEKLYGKMQQLSRIELNNFYRECAHEMAARLLRMLIQRTPVGRYPSSMGMQGGTLRRGWSVEEIQKNGNTYLVVVFNPTDYADYVEYGHRQTPGRYVPAIHARLKSAWVEGKFMMTNSENELATIAPALLEQKLERFVRRCFNDS